MVLQMQLAENPDMSTTPRPMPASTVEPGSQPYGNYWTWAALAVALAGVAGSLWLSVGMDLKACALCFYQRSFVMGIAAVLAVGLVARVNRPGLVSLLCLPMLVAGLWIAAVHTNLVREGKLECPNGVFGWGSAPSQSLTVYLILAAMLAVDVVSSGAMQEILPRVAAIAIGAAVAYGCLHSNPPPKAATGPDQPLDECRKPYVAPGPNP
jgi:disulfide bond formation protein DsbB